MPNVPDVLNMSDEPNVPDVLNVSDEPNVPNIPIVLYGEKFAGYC